MKRATRALLVILATGCVEQPPGDLGASLEAEWTINGSRAEAAACAAAGIETVELAVYDETDLSYEERRVVASAPCAGGRYDSEGARVLAEGRHLFAIDAVDAEGLIVASYEPEDVVDASTGAHVVLEAADFTTPTTLVVLLEWVPPPGTCDHTDVTSYSYALRDSAGAVVATLADLPCEDALFFEDVPADSYTLDVEGKDSTGTTRWTASCVGLAVADGQHVERSCAIERG